MSGERSGWSLRGRLARRTLVATGLVWCLVLVAGLGVMGHEMGELADDGLSQQADTIARLVEQTGKVPEAASQPGAAVRIVVPGHAAPTSPWPPLTTDGVHSAGLWTVARVSTPGGITVEVGEDGSKRQEDFGEAARVWLLLSAPLLGLMLVVVLATVRSALVPVATFAAAMERRRAADLSPTSEAGLPRELLPIPRALNSYLARIEALLAAERDFSANAAHELRTPLAVASAQAQLIAQGRAGPKAAEAVVAALSRLSRTVERLLDLARAETGRTAERADVVRVVSLLVSDHPAGRIRLDDGDIETMEVAADADSLALLIGNLLRNAVEHGTGPVDIVLRSPLGLEIRNPVPPGAAFLEDRLAAGPHSAGSGLGLAIARAVADRFGWTLDLAVREETAVARLCLRDVAPDPK
ncbi:MAG: HAMP domain-containing histidine kinase [Thermoanaerobaculia bacterium]|nr:HAMP domain-containing histidine kinase [Thermoanaerobaculia bacterium]